MKIFWFLKTIIFVKSYHDYFSPKKSHHDYFTEEKTSYVFFIALTKTISCFSPECQNHDLVLVKKKKT